MPQPGQDDFLRDAERFRGELLAHCYRMVGGLHEAEDLVQEVYLRAWRGWDGFEARSSVRTWLYRIATNLCLTALQHGRRRVLPSGLGAPGPEPTGEPLWLEPIPTAPDPAELVAGREGLRLALLASLQMLPSRQRAVFLLREALGFPAAEVADLLDMSVTAVKSALQRARATLAAAQPDRDVMTEPGSPEAAAILERYVAAFESADVAAMTDLLRADADIEVMPTGELFRGKTACLAQLADHVLTAPGRWRLLPTEANGQPAAVAYHRAGASGAYEPFGLGVLTVDARHIVTITTYADAGLVTRFGFPDHPPAPRRPPSAG